MPKLKIDLIVDDKGSVVVQKFGGNVLDMAKGFATGQLALDLLNRSLGLFRQEITFGLQAVEDYNLRVASMTAFITTFSQAAAEGDIAGGFREANEYAQALIPRLEILDARTVATGRDLAVMAETMAMNGVILDINNKKQEEGFVNIANALKLVTAGQNQDIQMRQEINALLTGQVRMTDRLPKLLQAIDPHLKEHLETWKQEGTLIENVGELLKGFSASTDLIAATWTAIGSTMETIHTRIIRGGLTPAYEDLLALATDTNRAFMDQDGNLTEMGQTLQGVIAVTWLDIKNTVAIVGSLLDTDGRRLRDLGEFVGMIFDGWSQILALLKPVAGLVGDIGAAMYYTAESLALLLAADISGAQTAWAKSGQLMGKALATNLRDEFLKEYAAWENARNIGASFTTGTAAAPQLVPGVSKEALDQAKKTAAEQAKIGRDLTDEIKKLTLEQYEYKKWALDQEMLDLRLKADQEKSVQESINQFGRLKELGLIRELAAEDRKLLDDRLKDYQAFYADLGQEIEQHVKHEVELLRALGDLYRQQSNLRRSTEGMISDLGGPGRSAAEQYKLTRSELEQQLQIARMLTGQDQLAALEQYKQGVHELAREFKEGFAGTGGEEIAGRAIRDIQSAYELQQQALRGLEADTQQQIETNRTWGQELQEEARKAAEQIAAMSSIIAQLDAQIAAMDQVLAITADDRASSTINRIRQEVEALHDKTITITAIYQMVSGTGGGEGSAPVLGSHALGTGYIPKTGPYYLHQGESVNTAAETRALSAGGGKYQMAAAGATFGDIHINLPPGTAPQSPEDYRRITRDYIIPELEAVGRG